MIKHYLDSIRFHLARRKSSSLIRYLKSKGISIGDGTTIPHPKTVTIDCSRPSLLTIGQNVRLNKDLTIQTHDFASMVFVNRDCEFIPSFAPIHIGNNVYFGQKCTVLKGVTIGDNCIIGFGSIVTKDIPSNSVAVGRPAKVICSLDDYLTKRKEKEVDEAIAFALSIYEQGRTPCVEDFYDSYTTFVDGSNYKDYPYPYGNVFSKQQFEVFRKNHKAVFHGFGEFLEEVNRRKNTSTKINL